VTIFTTVHKLLTNSNYVHLTYHKCISQTVLQMKAFIFHSLFYRITVHEFMKKQSICY